MKQIGGVVQRANQDKKMTKIKICGITNEKDALACEMLGADYIGFIFYKNSPRCIEPMTAKKIIKKLRNAKTVGVFVNEKADTIKKIAEYCNLDLIQLHGDESPEFCRKLKKITRKPIIKAIRIKNEKDLSKTKKYDVDYFLFDTYSKNSFGGTGKAFDWKVLNNIKKRYFLSGGLNTVNVKEAVNLKPFAVDTASGVEKSPRKKDHKRLKSFIEEAR